jgi:hypothetical protein
LAGAATPRPAFSCAKGIGVNDDQGRIAGGKERKLQLRKPQERGWTTRKRAIFLDHLAATCNVTASAAAAGLHWSGAYALRRRDTEFAAQWKAALAAGYARLEAMLIERATGTGPLPEAGEDAAPPPDARDMDPELALSLLKMHRAGVKGRARSGGRLSRASREETIRKLAKLLSALKRRRAKRAA